jgi:hypothetical protein
MTILAECPSCRKKQAVKNKQCVCGEDLVKAKRSKRVRYWIDYRVRGKHKREAVKGEGLDPCSIESAREMLSKRVVQKKEGRIFEMLPESRMTFEELKEWYLGLEKVKALAAIPDRLTA